jgi:hypothetical protein
MRPIFPFAAAEWRHSCETEVEGGKRKEARLGGWEEKGDVQLVAILYLS